MMRAFVAAKNASACWRLCNVAFVLTFWGADGDPGIYNSVVQSFGNFVESFVVNQEIDVENE
jgi:hypothetical protein